MFGLSFSKSCGRRGEKRPILHLANTDSVNISIVAISYLVFFLLFLFAEVAVFTSVEIYGMLNVNSTNTLQEHYQVRYIIANMKIALNLVEIINCCFFLGIILKSPSFVGFSTVVKDLCCLANFWALLLFLFSI